MANESVVVNDFMTVRRSKALETASACLIWLENADKTELTYRFYPDGMEGRRQVDLASVSNVSPMRWSVTFYGKGHALYKAPLDAIIELVERKFKLCTEMRYDKDA